jgi:putative ABC transport system permease protein
MLRRYRVSRMLYRLLLRAYPREFRHRFAGDLLADFAEMIDTRGRAHAWRRAASDLVHAVPLTATDALAEHDRVARITGPIDPAGESAMRSLIYDLRYAVRSLLRAPAFTGVTMLTLGLGIGVNSAIFSLVNDVLLRPLGYPKADRLMAIHEGILEAGATRFEVSPPDYLDLVAYQRSFSALGAYRTRLLELSGSGEPEQIAAAELTASVFDVLGVAAAQGRAFLPDEDQRAANVAVISHKLWLQRFAGTQVLGQALVLDRRPYTIVGVMPAGFEFPRRGPAVNSRPADVWLPLVFNPFEKQARGMMYNHSVIARLRDGVSPDQATADTAGLTSRIEDNYPAPVRNAVTLNIAAAPLVDELSGAVRRPLLFLLAAVALVLLVACANVANLILSRSLARQRDLGVRAALGAGRLRLFQVLLSEGLILAFGGGALGLGLAFAALRGIPAALAAGLPSAGDVPLDWRVVSFTSALALGSAVLFAAVPLLAGMRRDLHDLLREGSRTTAGRRHHRVQRALVVASVAFAFVLLVGAGLLLRSFNRLIAAPSGVQSAGVLTIQVRLPVAAYDTGPRIRTFYQTLEERLRAVPGARAVAVASDIPLDPDGERRVFTAERAAGRGWSSSVAVTWVHGDYFVTFGVPLMRGRTFSSDEQRENRRVAIVSQHIAATSWPGEDPVGKRLKWGPADSPAPWQTVIGVAGDVVDGAPGSEPVIHVYVPYTELPDAALASPIAGFLRRFVIAVKGGADPLTLAAPARAAVAALDPALPVSGVQTLAQIERHREAPQRFSALAVSGFGAVALLLASVGLYGVLTFAVSQRRREIGLRLALGSPPADVRRLILRQGMVLVASGLLIGAGAAALIARLLNAVLFETWPYDPVTFAAVPVVLMMVTMAASYLPARRAAAVDPVISLRSE